MAGLPFLILPIAIMVMAILLDSSSPSLTGAGGVSICSQPGQSNCIPPNSTGTAYACQPTSLLGNLQACKILPSCSAPPYPSPAFCIGDALTAVTASCFFQFLTSGAAGCGVYLPANTNVFIPHAQIVSSLSTSGAFFGFSASGASGFITMVGIAVGIISLAGLSVFGSGEQGEGLHILFMGGMVLGFWTILTGVEGFAGGSVSETFFNSLNAAYPGGGTFLYVMLTLSTVIGFVGLVSRGS
jgi:hypothetical protein